MLTIDPKAAQETFDFMVGKKLYSIPTMGGLPLPLLRKYVKQGSEPEVGIDLMLEILDRYAPGLADELPMVALAQIFEAYLKDADERGEALGES